MAADMQEFMVGELGKRGVKRKPIAHGREQSSELEILKVQRGNVTEGEAYKCVLVFGKAFRTFLILLDQHHNHLGVSVE